MIKFVDESGSINYCFCTVLVSCAVLYSFMVKLYAYTFLVNKKVCSHNVHHLVLWPGFRTYEFQCLMIVTWMPTEFMIQHLFKCIFKLGPRAVNMLRAPRCLNPALPICQQLARNQGRRGDFAFPEKFFAPRGKMCWTQFETFGPLSEDFRPPGVPSWLWTWSADMASFS